MWSLGQHTFNISGMEEGGYRLQTYDLSLSLSVSYWFPLLMMLTVVFLYL